MTGSTRGRPAVPGTTAADVPGRGRPASDSGGASSGPAGHHHRRT